MNLTIEDKIRYEQELLDMINDKIQSNHKKIKEYRKLITKLIDENNKLIPKSNDLFAIIKADREAQNNAAMNNNPLVLTRSCLFDNSVNSNNAMYCTNSNNTMYCANNTNNFKDMNYINDEELMKRYISSAVDKFNL